MRLTGLTLVMLLLTPLTAIAVFAGETESHARVAAAARAYIAARHPWQDMDTEVRVDSLDPRTKLSRCTSQLEAFLPPGGKIKRRTTVGVRCLSGRPWKIYLPVTVAAYARVMVSRHPIAPGQPIAPADVSWSRRDVATLGYGYLPSLDGAGGYRSRHSIAQGAVITSNMVEADDVIQKGQRVQLLSSSGAIAVSMSGVALQSAALGSRIRVKNLSSGKELEGTVESEQRVLLY